MLCLCRTVRANLCRLSVELPVSRQIYIRFYSLRKMNRGNNGAGHSRGRGSSNTGTSASRFDSVQADGTSQNISFGGKDGYSHKGHQTSQKKITGSVLIHNKQQPISLDMYEQDLSSCGSNNSSHTERLPQGEYSAGAATFKSVPGHTYEEGFPSLAASIGSSSKDRHFNRRTRIDLGPKQMPGNINSSLLESTPVANLTSQDESSLPTQLGKKVTHTHFKKSQSGQSYTNHAAGNKNSGCSKSMLKVESFDICFSKSWNSRKRKASLHGKNGENCNDMELTMEDIGHKVLRPGMVLLKHYLTNNEQIEIVKTCRQLGLGPGGFYRPGYQDGAKLRLQMMCLGLNWDPETRKYEDQRPVDGCKPPGIPQEFSLLVQRAMQDAHALICKDVSLSNVEDILPAVSPDICIVNFYPTSGRLGLHQDRDESKESLRKRLPVVSFSVGDSTEFLYGDQRDVDKAEKVVLESGDVLIFGGKSRHIFHGVPSIILESAPEALREEASLRPGRLNLTFRQF